MEDRVEKMASKAAYITMKDHKDNFVNKMPFYKSSKIYISHVSKTILSKLRAAIVDKNNTNLWRNTMTVLEWFKNVDH